MSFFGNIKYVFFRIVNRRPCAIKNSQIHTKAKVGNGAQLVNTKIGKYSYLYGTSAVNTDIGAFCSIAAGSTIGGGSHPTTWASSSPVFYKGKNVLNTNFSNNHYDEYKKTVIGNDVWIGSKCLIKGGVIIGDGAIIGMGSVVTKDIPPYEIWGGNPAHFIRKRFDDETINKLLALKWWNMDDEELKQCGDLFNNPDALIAYLEEKRK